MATIAVNGRGEWYIVPEDRDRVQLQAKNAATRGRLDRKWRAAVAEVNRQQDWPPRWVCEAWDA